MARPKRFLTRKLINYIIQKYGGGHRWVLRDEISEHGIVTYTDKTFSDRMLTINEMWEGKESQFPYIEIHITDSTGYIIRKDRYDYSDTDRKRIEFVYTEEHGHFYNEFRKVGNAMARPKQSKEAKIKELERRLKQTEGWFEDAQKRNAEMAQQAENSFLNSATYHQMQQEIEFFKSLNKLNEINLASANKRVRRADERLQQIYEDNKRMCEHEGDTEYWIGITECWREAKEYDKLREEIRELKGKVEQQEQAIADRDAEIKRLQWVIAKDKDKVQLAVSMERIGQLETEIEGLKSPTTPPDVKFYLDDEQMERINQTQAELEKANKENQELKERVNEESKQNREYWDRIRKLEGEVSRQKTLRIQTKQELDKTKRELEKAENRKYDQYVQEDAITYNEAMQRLRHMEMLVDAQTQNRQYLDERVRQLQEQVSDLATTTLPTEEAVIVIEQNIEQAKEGKSPKKSGRPPKVDERKMALIIELNKNGHSIRTIAEQLNMSVGSVHRYIKMNEKSE